MIRPYHVKIDPDPVILESVIGLSSGSASGLGLPKRLSEILLGWYPAGAVVIDAPLGRDLPLRFDPPLRASLGLRKLCTSSLFFFLI